MSTPKQFRYRDMKPGDAYYKNWRFYRSATLLIRGGVISFATGFTCWLLYAVVIPRLYRGILPGLLYGKWFSLLGGIGLPLLSLVGIATTIVGALLKRFSKCPQCGETNPCFAPTLFKEDRQLVCDRCNLPLWAPNGDEIGIQDRSKPFGVTRYDCAVCESKGSIAIAKRYRSLPVRIASAIVGICGGVSLFFAIYMLIEFMESPGAHSAPLALFAFIFLFPVSIFLLYIGIRILFGKRDVVYCAQCGHYYLHTKLRAA